MSDTTTLLHEYEVSRQLADRMNHASLTMKRSQRRPASAAELAEARTLAAATLAKVLRMLSTDLSSSDREGADADIPQELIEDLRERHGANMPYVLKDMAAAIKLLEAGQTPPAAIQVVDMLSQSADSVASASFRRLRRR
jgi:hypothetical protein